MLKNVEAVMFRSALANLVSWLDHPDYEEGTVLGVERFDRLTAPEKFAILEHVGDALLNESVPTPPHTAVAEAAIAAVYMQLWIDICSEIDQPRSTRETTVRQRVVDAAREFDFEVPMVKSRHNPGWRDLIEVLMDQVLWDRDYEEEFIGPDDSPEVAEHVRKFAMIDPDYYAAVPPDPNPAQLKVIRDRLRTLAT